MIGKLQFVMDGCEVINYAHSATVVASTPIYVAGLGVLVPQVSADASVVVAYYKVGVFRAKIATAVAVVKGDPLYYDTATDSVQKTVPAAGFFIGTAVEDGTATAGYVNVAINVQPMSVRQGEFRRLSTATVATAGIATQTAAQYVGGLILRDPAGASRVDTTPTAALLVAAISGVVADGAIRFVIENTADAEEDITLAAGVGVTLDPTSIVIRRGERRELMAQIVTATSGAEAVTIYDLSYKPSSTANIKNVGAPYDGADTVLAITAAMVKNGVVYGAVTAGRTWTIDSAANILALYPNARIGDTVELVVVNNAAGANSITVAVPTSITNLGLAGHLIVTQNTRGRFLIRFTNVTGGAEAASLIPA